MVFEAVRQRLPERPAQKHQTCTSRPWAVLSGALHLHHPVGAMRACSPKRRHTRPGAPKALCQGRFAIRLKGNAILLTMAQLKAYLGVARAPFLLLPITLVAVGAAVGVLVGDFSPARSFLALVGLLALHMAVNILNEWSDQRTGIDLRTKRTPFSGGSGTLPSGSMEASTALIFGLLSAAAGLAIGVWFVILYGWVLVPPFALGAVCVLAYTNVLARSGVGELAAGLGLGALPVACTAYVQGGNFTAAAWAASVPAFFMTFNLLLLNEFPDEEADRFGRRRNLVILLGRKLAARVYAIVALATPTSIIVAVVLDMVPPHSLAALLPSLLLAKPLTWALGDVREDVPVPALAANVAWNLATNTVLAAALALAGALGR